MTRRTAYIQVVKRNRIGRGYSPQEALELAKEAWERRKERNSDYYL